jgi:hypothetical protein
MIAATLSLLATIVFGVVTWLHFGKGLAHYRSSAVTRLPLLADRVAL